MKVAIVGGGGTRTPVLVKGLLGLDEDLKLEEISLFDTDLERLSLIFKVIEGLRPPNSKIKFRKSENLKEALRNCSFVFLTIRAGKEEMRVLDEQIPIRMGLIGQETVGAGGAAMAVRTIPQVLEVSRVVKEECPSAWVINFTNPSGIITEALLNFSPLQRVIGICDGPSSMKLVLSRFLEVPEEEIFLDYFGLNHLGWVRGIFVRGEDFLPKVMKYLPMFQGIENVIRIPVEFIKNLGMIPNPYLRYYYFPQRAFEELKREKKTRGEKVKEMNDSLFFQLKDEKSNPVEIYKDYLRGRESQYAEIKEGVDLEEGEGYIKVALEILRGLSGLKVGTPVVNVKNLSAIPGMGPDDVVEVPCHLLSGFVRPVACGPVPQQSVELMKKVKIYEKKLVQAVIEKSPEGIVEALSLNPLVGDMEVARRLYEEFSRKQTPYWPLNFSGRENFIS